MAQIDDYIQIMVDSLTKKSEILARLISMNESQSEIVKGKEFADVNWDKFNIVVAEKEAEINRINEMDEGFQALYDRVKEQLNAGKSNYAAQIKEMQRLIALISDQSIQIQTGEEKNRATIERIMNGRKSEIKQARTSLKAATSYYQTMQKTFLGETPSSMDRKK